MSTIPYSTATPAPPVAVAWEKVARKPMVGAPARPRDEIGEYVIIEGEKVYTDPMRHQRQTEVRQVKKRVTGNGQGLDGQGPWRPVGEVEPERVRWLWYPRIPMGKVTLLAGDPGDGKGFVTMSITAAVTTGNALLDTKGRPSKGDVLIASFEDGPADTLRPRLDNAGADVDRVLLLDQFHYPNGQPRPFAPHDVPILASALEHRPGARLLIVDPIGSYLGATVNSDKDNQVRGVLQPLADLAHQRRLAVLVVAHLNKSELQRALYRLSGSIGFVGLARSVLMVGKDPETGQRALAHIKNSLGPTADSLEFSIVNTENEAGLLRWGKVSTALTAERMLGSGRERGRPPSERECCEEEILVALKDGPVAASQMMEMLDGFAEMTIRRARKSVGIVTYQPKGSGDHPGWWWRLPEHAENSPAQ